MSELLVDTARQIKKFATEGAHPSRIICYGQLSFRAEGDVAGESTRLIGASPLRNNPDGLHIEEIGYMAGGIGSPWLKPVILPEGAEEVRIIGGLITGLPRGTWSRIFDEVEDQVARSTMEMRKSQYGNWLDTGNQPSWVEDPTPSMVTARTEAAWEALKPDQIEVLENGLNALLLSLQEEPQQHILSLPLRTKGIDRLG